MNNHSGDSSVLFWWSNLILFILYVVILQRLRKVTKCPTMLRKWQLLSQPAVRVQERALICWFRQVSLEIARRKIPRYSKTTEMGEGGGNCNKWRGKERWRTIKIRHYLALNLLTTTIGAPPSNASKWQTGFNSAFTGMHEKPTNTPIIHSVY